MSTPVGTYTFHKTSLDQEADVLITFDFSERHEIEGGATVSSATMRVLLNGTASSDFTLSSQANTSTAVQVRVTDASAIVTAPYHLVCDVTLSDTTRLVEWILIDVEWA